MEDGTGDINGNMEMDIYTEEEVNTTNDEDRMEDENWLGDPLPLPLPLNIYIDRSL